MISVQQAIAQIRTSIPTLPEVTIPIQAALGRVLAEQISASQDLPSLDNSGMDGIAVVAADTQNASPDHPVTLPLVGSIPAGTYPETELQPGQAVQIMTGAALPPGADAVIPVEQTNLDYSQPVSEKEVRIFTPARPGDHIREKGGYYRKGDVLVPAGQVIRPQDVAMFATVGKAQVKVIRQPRVGMLSTGDELTPPGQPLEPGKIWDSNTYMLAALLERSGASVHRTGIIPDERGQIIGALNSLADIPVDLLLTSGGVSMGAYDLVRQVMESEGTLDLWKVNMRPGKPLAFGTYRQIPFIGLPGNPVSAFVGYQIFVQEGLRQMQGLPPTEAETIQAALASPVHSDGRESYIPASLFKQDGKWVAQPDKNPSSGNLYALIPGNSLIIVPVGVKFLNINDVVKVRLLD